MPNLTLALEEISGQKQTCRKGDLPNTEPSPQSNKHPFSGIDKALDTLGKPIKIYGDDISLKMSGHVMHRFEYWNNYNFNDATYEDDPFNLLRFRLGTELTLGPYLKVYAEGQDARNFASQSMHKGPYFVNHLDLHQLYAEVKSPWEKIPVAVKVGRQQLSYGDERFFSTHDCYNPGYVFDAAKLIMTPTPWLRGDFWFAQFVQTDTGKPDSASHHENIYGIYTTLGPFSDQSLDTFLFIRHNRYNEIAGERTGELGQMKQYTAGNRFKGKKWNFDYGIEWALQSGTRADNVIRAWAWHNELGYTFPVPWSPRLLAEYNYGSGDDDVDGRYELFDDFYPASYYLYGCMDFTALSNLHHVRIKTSVQPHPKLNLSVSHNWVFLDTNRSPWVSGIHFANRAAQEDASTTVGQELNLMASWQISKHLHFLIGYFRFFAGGFINDTGTNDDAQNLFVQTMLKI